MKAVIALVIAVLLGLNVWQYLEREQLRGQVRQSNIVLVSKAEEATATRERTEKLVAANKALSEKIALFEGEVQAESKQPTASGKDTMKALAEAMENPAMKDMMAAQQRATLDAQYQRLYENLSLEGEELEHFQNLITDAQMIIMENGMKMLSGDRTPEERQEIAKSIATVQADLKANVREFLNDDPDYDYYAFYTDTLGERVAMNGLRSTLEAPLDVDTEEALVKLMYDERQAIGFEDHYYDQNQFDPSSLTQAKIDRFMGQFDELQSNLAKSADTLLSREQLEAFQANQKTSRAMQEMGLGMLFNMFRKEQP